jgi:hypothetical protein
MYFNVYESDEPSRSGLNGFYFYQEATPVPSAPDFQYTTSFVAETNSAAVGNAQAYGWYVAPAYTVSRLPWSPPLSYRFASFSGGGTRNFDSLFAGLSDWGYWFQGELLGELLQVSARQPGGELPPDDDARQQSSTRRRGRRDSRHRGDQLVVDDRRRHVGRAEHWLPRGHRWQRDVDQFDALHKLQFRMAEAMSMSMTVRLASHALELCRQTVQKAGMMVRRARRVRRVRVAAPLSVALLLASCATIQQSVGGWFGGRTPTPAPEPTPAAAAQAPRVYYAGVEGLKVYNQPSTSSKVVGTLSLHEKVTRTKLDRGWAYLESTTSGAKGWVNNAQLIWRLPTTPTTGAPAPGEAQPEAPAAPTGEEPQTPVAPEATAPAAELPATPTSTPVSAAPPTPKATARGVAPSIFNPY